ncbi:dTDP-4-dehydrorhamnose reductase [Bombella sp. TMW 2.2559]|uniref:dTDP-4-dehydrorhamnose reductase n=1 Tax=Bombella dulcis TaxID=2967339 RepID=A0ABT3WBM8_9PROT|nr:dTDP-4-dehydrorhamnose reductase [Bombella dulcis]MCX5616497.1 dTDP-4-dehydrorhamnose reductase [Bombella dulcis]
MTKAFILVIGRTGQLASSLKELGGDRVVTVGRPEADLQVPETLTAVIEAHQPEVIVNAAAWTAVDLAETEQEAAKQGNHTGPAHLAAEAARRHVPFIHVSTDYVFDGRKGSPYLESDPISPVTAYGRTKAEGEAAVLKAQPQSIILRTAWVYSAHGKNFVRTMLNAGAKNPRLRVVGDQRGNPTSSDDLAAVVLGIIDRIRATGWQDSYAGIFHATGSGEATWHELACHALEQAARHGQAMPEVEAIMTADWPTPAARPADSRLDNGKLERVFGQKMPDWRDSVARTVDQLMKANA